MKHALLILSALFLLLLATDIEADLLPSSPAPGFRLGNERFLDENLDLVAGKRVGLITNQSGVTSTGASLIEVFAAERRIKLTALYGPEHGIDGKARAGAWVESYQHPTLGIPVYSLYGATRKPTPGMLAEVDVLIFDIQDIGARTYTYISTMNYAMLAAAENQLPMIILDRPNPLGGTTVEGPVLENEYKTFVGVDNLPMAHGMTIGELARYFNRLIGADITIIPMQGYHREMIYQDTGLEWVQTSPNIPHLDSVFGYLATGLAEGTGIHQADQFTWVGGSGLDADEFARLLNSSQLPGIRYRPETRNGVGGVRLEITDYHRFNPARSGLHALFHARSLWNFPVPKSPLPKNTHTMVMFDKVMGTSQVGIWLDQNLSPVQVEKRYQEPLAAFNALREDYLLYGYPGNSQHPSLVLNGHNLFTAVKPIIANDRTLVPVRAILEHMGALVSWVEDEKAVLITRADTTIRLVINSHQATVNGTVHTLDTAPVIIDDRSMLPVRFIAEHLGAAVDWCPHERAVLVTYAP